jgi:hypothetical protein
MDSDLSRREFLERTALAAGAAGAAALPTSALLAQEAQAHWNANPLPSPRNIPIDHFVILMMENRSYDHYFGWMREGDGDQTQSFPNALGQQVPTRHFSTLGTGGTQYKGCGHPDPGHGWESGRAQLNGGFLAPGSGNDEFALTYFNKGELGFIHEAARNYTSYDRYFCSLLASTWPNRFYKWSAQSGGLKSNTVNPGGNAWETIFDRAISKGLTARYYASDLPFAALFGPRSAAWINPISRYYEDCFVGTLPNIAIVDPPFKDGGGGDGLSADEHPLGDVRLGQAFMADIVRAFTSTPELPPRRVLHHLRRVGRLLRPREAAEGARRARQHRSQRGFRAARLPRSGRGGVAVCPAREEEVALRAQLPRLRPRPLQRRPRPLRARVDPQVHLVPVRPRRPQQAHEVRQQHRAQLRVAAARLRGPAAAEPARHRHPAVRARRRRRGGQPARSRQ